MEAWESSDRIRPLPPEAPPSPTPPGSGGSPRSWIPLAIAGIALGAFAVGSTLFTRAEPGDGAAVATTTTTTTTTVPPLADAAPSTTTTTTTLPPLNRRIPDTTQVLLVMSDGSGSAAEWWSVGFREAVPFDLGASATDATFNVDATLVALLSNEDDEQGTLRVGEPAGIATRFTEVTSVAWHDDEPRRIAFVARLPLEDQLSLLTATVSGADLRLTDLRRVATFDVDGDVVAWGDWGFVVNTRAPITIASDGAVAESEQALTVTLDPDGTEVARTEGWVIDRLPEGRLLVRTFWDVLEMSEDGIAEVVARNAVTRTDATLAPDGRYDLLTPDAIAFLNPNGSNVTEVNINPSGVTLVTSRNFDRQSNRSASVPGFLDPLGFTSDGSLFVLHDPIEDELVFLDWSTSTQYRLPTGEGRALAVDAR
jgi:hypothetical protein